MHGCSCPACGSIATNPSPRPDALFIEDNPGVDSVALSMTRVSPKLGVIRQLNETLSAFVQYARGFRAPPHDYVNINFTNLAFGYTAIANPDLRPELSQEVEAGPRGCHPGGHLELSVLQHLRRFHRVTGERGDAQWAARVSVAQRGAGAHLWRGTSRQSRAFLTVRCPGRLEAALEYRVCPGQRSDEWGAAQFHRSARGGSILGPAYERHAWGVELVGTAVDRPSRVDHPAGRAVRAARTFHPDLLLHARMGERLRINAGLFNLMDGKYWEWADVRGRPADDGDRPVHAPGRACPCEHDGTVPGGAWRRE